MQRIGKLVCCDRCGESIFLVKNPTRLSGTNDAYMNKPEGWLTNGNLDFCPKCSDEFSNFMSAVEKNREFEGVDSCCVMLVSTSS